MVLYQLSYDPIQSGAKSIRQQRKVKINFATQERDRAVDAGGSLPAVRFNDAEQAGGRKNIFGARVRLLDAPFK